MKTAIFVLQVGDQEPEFHETREEALEAGRQAVKDMFDPQDFSWGQYADQIFVAEIIAVSHETNRVDRPPTEELDDEGFDAEGIEWPAEVEYICDYELIELNEIDGSEDADNATTIH